MPAVRPLLARVARLEQARAPVISPFAHAYGSFDAFAVGCQEEMYAGRLDRNDVPVILSSCAAGRRTGRGAWWRRARTWQLAAD